MATLTDQPADSGALAEQLRDAQQHRAALEAQLAYQRQAMALDFPHAIRRQLGQAARDCAARFPAALRERPADAMRWLLALPCDPLHRQILRLAEWPPTDRIPAELLRGGFAD